MSVKEDKAKKVQSQVNEVVGIMQQNIEKVIDRGDRFERLEEQTDELQGQAQQFKRGATKIRKRMWWNNMKLNIIIAVVVIIIIIIIAVSIYFSTRTVTDPSLPTQKP